jgi:hypothetical protein
MDHRAGSSCNLITSEVITTFTFNDWVFLCYEDH